MATAINSVQRYTPSSGGTITILDADENIIVFLDQGSSLSSLTINWPASPYNGQIITLVSLSTISGITNSGASFNTAPASIPANQSVSYIFDVTADQWNLSGAVIPTSKTIVGTNASGQIIDATSATLSNNTSGTAANITATSNSTLTTLSALSLPISQTTGTLANAQVPAPTTSALGGVKAASAATSNQFMTYVDTAGAQHVAQPAFTNLSGAATQSQMPAVLMSSGVYASKPGSPSQGQLYYATDLGTSGCLLIYNSSKWMPVSGTAILYHDTTWHYATATGSEQNLCNYKIPAGLLSANGSIEVWAQGRYVSTNSTKYMTWRFSATQADTSGGYQALYTSPNGGGATALEANAYKAFFNVSSQSSQIYTASAISSIGTYSSSGMAAGALATTSTWYVNLNFIDSSTSDTVGYQGVIIKWNEA